MAKVSIIIPIYNAERYLKNSIESVCNQTLQDIEIILVNDGSTDNSLQICEKYASIDHRIKIIDKKNEGVSVARNKGMELATSEYITFVDPDDEVEIDMYENLYMKICKNKCDVILCNYIQIDKMGSLKVNLPIMEGTYERDQIQEILLNIVGGYKLEKTPIMGSVWRGMYKKSLVDKHNLKFPADIRPMQDLVFITNYLAKCNTMYIDENFYYIYYIRPNTGVTGYKNNMWHNNKKVSCMLEDVLKENNLEVEGEVMITNRVINLILGAISNEAHSDNKSKLYTKLKNIKKITEDEFVYKYMNLIDDANLKIMKKLILFCVKSKLALPLYIYYSFVRKIRCNY